MTKSNFAFSVSELRRLELILETFRYLRQGVTQENFLP